MTCKRGFTVTLAGFVESARNWSGGCVDTVLTLFVLKVDIVNPCMLTALVLSSPLGPRTNSREFKLDREAFSAPHFGMVNVRSPGKRSVGIHCLEDELEEDDI